MLPGRMHDGKAAAGSSGDGAATPPPRAVCLAYLDLRRPSCLQARPSDTTQPLPGMQAHAAAAWLNAEAGAPSDGMTPGVSVAAHADTPRSPSPRRLTDDHPSGNGGAEDTLLQQAAAAAAVAGAGAADHLAAPLSKPTLRVQGSGDIILEDATSPQHQHSPGAVADAFISRHVTTNSLEPGPSATPRRPPADVASPPRQRQQHTFEQPARLSRNTTSGTNRAVAATPSRHGTQPELGAGGEEAGHPPAAAAAAAARPLGMNGGDGVEQK